MIAHRNSRGERKKRKDISGKDLSLHYQNVQYVVYIWRNCDAEREREIEKHKLQICLEFSFFFPDLKSPLQQESKISMLLSQVFRKAQKSQQLAHLACTNSSNKNYRKGFFYISFVGNMGNHASVLVNTDISGCIRTTTTTHFFVL